MCELWCFVTSCARERIQARATQKRLSIRVGPRAYVWCVLRDCVGINASRTQGSNEPIFAGFALDSCILAHKRDRACRA